MNLKISPLLLPLLGLTLVTGNLYAQNSAPGKPMPPTKQTPEQHRDAANPQGTQGSQKPHRPMRQPPAQAFELCKGKKQGEQVQITTPRGHQIKAQCTNSPEGLFARPEHPPRDNQDQREGARKQRNPER